MNVCRATIYSAASALLFMGCSSTPPPRAEMARAEMALSAARQSAAPQHAPLELRTAGEKFDHAKQAMADERYDRARRLAEQALVEAQLAEIKARSAEAQQMTRELRESIEALRAEAVRKDGSAAEFPTRQ